MLEIIILLIIGALIISVFQGARRGGVSPEERKTNPTLLESVSAGLDDLDASSSKMLLETKANVKYHEWYEIRKLWIRAALKLAVNQDKRCRYLSGSASGDHEAFAEYNEKTASALEAVKMVHGEEKNLQHGWITNAAPVPPDPFEPHAEYDVYLRAYRNAAKEFDAFIDKTTASLRESRMLNAFFERKMRKLQLEPLLDAHFPEVKSRALQFWSYWEPNLKSQSIWGKAQRQSYRGKSMISVLELNQTHVPKKLSQGTELRTLAEGLDIPHLVHFTRCDNLPSILSQGLHSVESSRASGLSPIRNDQLRLDQQLNGISLSITFPNYLMFYKYRQLNDDVDWVVLLLSPKILWEQQCGFFKHNAADARMLNQPRKKVSTAAALLEMFETCDGQRDAWLRRFDPTDPQAEVMVYDTIEPRHIQTIAFETKAARDRWKPVLSGIDTICPDPNKGLFSSRRKARLN